MTTRSLARLVASLFIVLLGGCGEEVVVKRMKPLPAKAVEVEPVEDITEALAQFAPPFPGQIVLFEPDKKKPTKASGGNNAVTNRPAVGSLSEPDVELMGFGAVDAKHALLMIDGQVEALRVGEQHRNVQVLKIDPPRVKLRVAGRIREKAIFSEKGE